MLRKRATERAVFALNNACTMQQKREVLSLIKSMAKTVHGPDETGAVLPGVDQIGAEAFAHLREFRVDRGGISEGATRGHKAGQFLVFR